MAESVSKAGMFRLLMLSMLLLASVAHAGAQDNFPDPTRPPAALGGGGVASTAASGPVLQSVLIAPRRKVAVISGETVQVGDRLGDARVTKIAEGEVVLVRGGQTQTLRLFPGIEKQRTKAGLPARVHGRQH